MVGDLNKSTQLVSVRAGIPACDSMILIREPPVLWTLFSWITIHVLSYHITQTEIHFSVPRLQEKSQSAQKSIQQQVCHWSSLLVVIFCVCAWLLSVSSENPHVRWQSPLHTSHSSRRGSVYFESFVSLLQFKGKKNKVLNTYQHNHLHVSFFFNT